MKDENRRGLGPAVVACGILSACAHSAVLRAADAGDRIALRESIAQREKAGDLSNAEAASLAKAVAEHDLRAAPSSEAVAEVRDLRACGRALDAALAERMETHDAAGAEAALARIESQALDVDDAGRLARGENESDAPWRAVAVRALVRDADHARRMRALVDGDPRVRREAVRAERDARDRTDLPQLFEAARLDPSPLVRTEAVRAIAGLPPVAAGVVANGLHDLWTGADDALRADIARAWASPSVWDAGGRDMLSVVVASDHGPGAIEAAVSVLGHHGPPRGGDEILRLSAMARLAASMANGPRYTRLQAIRQSPLEPHELLTTVAAAAHDDDLQVRVVALSRLAETKSASAVLELESLARPGSPVATEAQSALARAGDRRVQAWIEADLVSPSAEGRVAAAVNLAALGSPGRAAPLLADETRSVRARAACTILRSVR